MLAERQHLVGQPTPRCPEQDGRVHLVRKGVLAVRPAKSCQDRNQALVSNGRACTRRGTRKGHAVPGPLVLGRSDLQGLDNRVVLVHLAPPWAEPGSVGVDPLLARLVPGGAVPGPWAGHAARIRQRSAGAGAWAGAWVRSGPGWWGWGHGYDQGRGWGREAGVGQLGKWFGTETRRAYAMWSSTLSRTTSSWLLSHLARCSMSSRRMSSRAASRCAAVAAAAAAVAAVSTSAAGAAVACSSARAAGAAAGVVVVADAESMVVVAAGPGAEPAVVVGADAESAVAALRCAVTRASSRAFRRLYSPFSASRQRCRSRRPSSKIASAVGREDAQPSR